MRSEGTSQPDLDPDSVSLAGLDSEFVSLAGLDSEFVSLADLGPEVSIAGSVQTPTSAD